MFGGLFLAACGVFVIFMLYGFGTMMDPTIQGAAREAAIWSKVVREPIFPFSILLIVVGGWLMSYKPKRAV
jgi:hypothetical protein